MSEDCLHLSIWVPQHEPAGLQRQQSRRRRDDQPENRKQEIGSSEEHKGEKVERSDGQQVDPENIKGKEQLEDQENIKNKEHLEDKENNNDGGQLEDQEKIKSDEQLEDQDDIKNGEQLENLKNSTSVDNKKENMAVLVWMTSGKN